MLKEISEPFNILGSISVSGTTTIVSSSSSIKYKDSVAYAVNFSTGVQGTVNINGSVDYNPGLPQSGGVFNGGNWVTVVTQTIGSGTLNPILFNMNQLAFPWIQLSFTNSTASGTLSAWFAAKSLG